MNMIPREIIGPQERFERSGVQNLRDIRPFTTRLSEALRGSVSGLILMAAGIGTLVYPAALDISLPVSCLYAAWVLTRRVKLPMRLPRTSGLNDYGNPIPGSRRPRRAAGDWFIGSDAVTGQELWATFEDMRQHATLPGTTGAGKSTVILSPLTNALAQGSGFVLVDGKADRELFGKVLALALARRFGRDDDVRVLNFMVASGSKDSHTWNALAAGNADALRELLASQLGEKAENDANGVFRDRAVALIGTIAPVLVWLRDRKGITLNIEVVRLAIELRWIWKLAMRKIVILRDSNTGVETELDVSKDIPEDIVWPLKAYLGELPGYDPSVPLDKQKGDEPSKQHGFAQFYFTATFTQLAVSLGHIFRVENGDIDMRDVVLNRRILVVNLPALENSDATLAALGKLVVASLRGMMAQLLGASLEGDYSASSKTGIGLAPYVVVLDELAYYATSGLDRMLAMGRGLNMSFLLAFQEVSGIWARLGEKTASLLGNANLTIAMRQQDAGRTRQWIEQTAGQTYITQATSYHGANDGNYREAKHAEVRQVARVDWNDLTRLIEGEAIVLFSGRRIYAKLFHVEIDDSGPKRLSRGVTLQQPKADEICSSQARIRAIANFIQDGVVVAGAGDPASPGLQAMLAAFCGTARTGGSADACIDAALAAVRALPADKELGPVNPSETSDDTPVTVVSPMLNAASRRQIGGTEPSGEATEPVDAALLESIAACEELGGVGELGARATALRIIGERDEVLREITIVEPPAMTPEELARRVGVMLGRLEQVRASHTSSPGAA